MFATFELVFKGHNWALFFVLMYGSLALWSYAAAQNSRKAKSE